MLAVEMEEYSKLFQELLIVRIRISTLKLLLRRRISPLQIRPVFQIFLTVHNNQNSNQGCFKMLDGCGSKLNCKEYYYGSVTGTPGTKRLHSCGPELSRSSFPTEPWTTKSKAHMMLEDEISVQRMRNAFYFNCNDKLQWFDILPRLEMQGKPFTIY